ncbi:MAG: hypothetical protein UY69_C0030G0006, partial [Parcubacteria group bacterium GW2011_GWF1_52_5]
WLIVVAMLAVMALMLVYFKRKRWF